MKSQIATSKAGRGGRRINLYAFTQHGAIILASVLNSSRAIEVSVFVVRAFVKIRQLLTTYEELAKKLSHLEKKIASHNEHIKTLFTAIRQLMAPPTTCAIGFRVEKK